MSSSPLRELREGDAEAVAALFVEAYGAARPLDAEEIETWRHNEELKPEWLRVLERDGRVVGYGDIWIEGDELALDLAAPPAHRDVFLDWAEEQGRLASVDHVRVSFPSGHELESVLAARGYVPARSSFTMEIELEEPPVVPAVDGIELRPYRDGDAENVRHALNESFAGQPQHHEVSPSNFREFWLKSRGVDTTLWTLAWDADEPAGFVLAFPERTGEPELGWVATLGVRPTWRRRGLGEALLRTAFAGLYDRGLRRVGLGVDADNVTGAVRLYERVGMRVVRRFDSRELRT